MATEWYYFRGEQRFGPVGSSQLKDLAIKGKLQPTDLVWKQGMAAPQPASKLDGLFSTPTAPAPPSPTKPTPFTPTRLAIAGAISAFLFVMIAISKVVPEATNMSSTDARGTASSNSEREDESIVEWPSGLTEFVGVRVAKCFSKDKLREIAGKFIQNEIRPGWELQRVIDVLGKPTKFSRTNGFIGMSPEEKRDFLNNPLVPPSVKAHMRKTTEICTWYYSDDPDNKFIMLGFTDGRLNDSEGSIIIALP